MGRELRFQSRVSPGSALAAILVAASACIFSAAPARAYIRTVTSGGVPVRWVGQPKLDLAGNPANSSGLSDSDFRNAVVRSLQRWNAASGGAVGFDYWQGRDNGNYEPDSDYNGLSSVYFASNAKSDPHLSPNVLGLTQVWYNTDNGQIMETDIVLNDRDFRFTTNPGDTSGYGSSGGSSFNGGKVNVYIENVLTHEIGHAYGLSHSGGLQSTMLFMESPEQAHLGCDEITAINAMYSGDGGARGTLQGTIVSVSGAPVFGAHVVAISRRRGTVIATGMTDRSGAYHIAGLEPGSYFVMVEPYFAGPAALPSYYSGASSGVCPGGTPFGRTVLTGPSGYIPLDIPVPAGGVASAPTLVAQCGNYGGAAIAATTGSSSTSSAPVIYGGSGSGFGAVDRFSYQGVSYYRLRSVGGHVEARAMTYSLYSPVRPQISLQDASGNPVPVTVAGQVYVGDSGYVNYDSALTADNLPTGDYVLKVTATSMDASHYPAGPVSIDSVPFLVITGSVNEDLPVLAASLPYNARCRMTEAFAAYSSPAGDPPRRSIDNGGGGGGIGFCGTVSAIGSGSGGGNGGGGPTPGAMAGWLLPWAAMLLIARLAKRGLRAQAGLAAPALSS